MRMKYREVDNDVHRIGPLSWLHVREQETINAIAILGDREVLCRRENQKAPPTLSAAILENLEPRGAGAPRSSARGGDNSRGAKPSVGAMQ